jgi:hypothetical protein
VGWRSFIQRNRAAEEPEPEVTEEAKNEGVKLE